MTPISTMMFPKRRQEMNKNPKHRLHLTRRPKGFKEVPLYPVLPLPERAQSIRYDLLIAMVPLLLLSVYHYGFRPITLTLVSLIAMTGLDFAVKKLLKKEYCFDILPIVSGVMIALFLPASAPLWLPIITAVFATAVKVGCDKLKFSLSSVAVSLLLSFLLFPGIMNAIPEAGRTLNPFAISLRSFRAIPASPLEKVISGFLPDTTTFETFFGLNAARIGEISGLLIAIGFIYLLIRKTVKPILPLTFIITVGVFAYLNPSLEAASDAVALDGAIYNVFGSNTFLTAAFLMSEPKRAPKTLISAVFCGVFGGIVTMLLRGRIPLFLTALIAVILIDVLSPVANRFIKPTPFGGSIAPQKDKGKEESDG